MAWRHRRKLEEFASVLETPMHSVFGNEVARESQKDRLLMTDLLITDGWTIDRMKEQLFTGVEILSSISRARSRIIARQTDTLDGYDGVTQAPAFSLVIVSSSFLHRYLVPINIS